MQVSFKVRRSSTKHDRYLNTRCLGIQIPMLDEIWAHAASVAAAAMTSNGEAANIITICQINILQPHVPNSQPTNEQSRTCLPTDVSTNQKNARTHSCTHGITHTRTHTRTGHCKSAAMSRLCSQRCTTGETRPYIE